MLSEKYLEDATRIGRDELLECASLGILVDSVEGVPDIASWALAGVKKDPLEIYDINGKLLFLDYAVTKGAEILGHVRTGASAILGSPIRAYELGPRHWSFGAAVKKLTPEVRKKHRGWKLLRTKLVCYSYPKLGVMFECEDENRKAVRLIYDVASLSPVREGRPESKVEGAYAWSFYDSLGEAARRSGLKRYGEVNALRLQIPSSTRRTIRAARSLGPYAKKPTWRAKFEAGSNAVVKKLQFCPHYSYSEARSHRCFVLHGQQLDDYCAVATCQMILCYYRYYYSQDDIAPALDYSPGGCPADHSAGYEELSCNHLDATYDDSPTFTKAKVEIDQLHPLKSGVPGHARACAGYSYVRRGCGHMTERKLYIYDPWPWDEDYKLAGTIEWEDWDGTAYTNFITTRLLCP